MHLYRECYTGGSVKAGDRELGSRHSGGRLLTGRVENHLIQAKDSMNGCRSIDRWDLKDKVRIS